MWGAWGHGGKLIIVPQAVSRSPIDFYRLVCREGVTVLNQTPGAFKAFYHVRDNMCHQLRYVIFGGEMLKPKELTPWYAHNAEQSPLLVNMYGITETTIHVTHGRLSKRDTFLDRSPIGQRIIDLSGCIC
jgi:non-ribosomal peptide synthetase component F